jgi:hypothetical protein
VSFQESGFTSYLMPAPHVSRLPPFNMLALPLLPLLRSTRSPKSCTAGSAAKPTN